MIAPDALRALREALGPVCADERSVVDGEPLAPTLRPAGPEQLADALAALTKLRLACVIRGGGSRLDLGNPPRGAVVLLSTASLEGIDEFDAGEGVCHVRAGTRLAAVDALVGARGWQLPLDPPGAASTVGGALAAAAHGPRAQGFGRPRDCVLGLEVVLSDGVRTRCGGRVVKNVTGYDLNKLYTGSLGTLGVIESAWLRLRPQPQRVAVLESVAAGPAEAFAAGLAAARRVTARAVAAWAPPRIPGERGFRVLVELAGDGASVERDALWCADRLGAQTAASDALAGVRELQGSTPDGVGLRFRVAVAPSRGPAAALELWQAGASVLVYPGLGLLYAGFPLPAAPDPAPLAAAFQSLEQVRKTCGGEALLEAAPAWAKAGRDVFGEPGGRLPLVRRLKQRFDPAGLLNPGRFAGCT